MVRHTVLSPESERRGSAGEGRGHGHDAERVRPGRPCGIHRFAVPREDDRHPGHHERRRRQEDASAGYRLVRSRYDRVPGDQAPCGGFPLEGRCRQAAQRPGGRSGDRISQEGRGSGRQGSGGGGEKRPERRREGPGTGGPGRAWPAGRGHTEAGRRLAEAGRGSAARERGPAGGTARRFNGGTGSRGHDAAFLPVGQQSGETVPQRHADVLRFPGLQ